MMRIRLHWYEAVLWASCSSMDLMSPFLDGLMLARGRNLSSPKLSFYRISLRFMAIQVLLYSVFKSSR